MSQAYRVALLCWALPLVGGLLVFFTWTKTREPALMSVGSAILLVGTVLFFAGLLVLMRGHITAARSVGDVSPGHWGKTTLLILLLASNFPVAAAVGLAAAKIDSGYSVEIQNATATVIEDCMLEVNRRVERLGDIRPGESVSQTFWIQGDGSLVFSGSAGNVRLRKTVDEYATGLGGHKKLIINEGLTITIVDLKR